LIVSESALSAAKAAGVAETAIAAAIIIAMILVDKYLFFI
jgi:hypothetical protein